MLSRLSRFAALAVALAIPAAALAQDKKTDAKKSDGPSVLVRVQSVNDLIKTVEYIGTLLPEDPAEKVKQGAEFVKSLIDEKKGIEGIDVKHPIGLYATLTPELTTSLVVGLIPVADWDTVIAALKNRAMLEIKEKDGLYETTPPQSPVTIYFRYANDYAYVTANDPENINPKNLPKPAEVLGGKAEHLISASIRIDRLPDQMKKMALGTIENKLAELKEQAIPDETKAIKAFKEKFIDEVVANLKSGLDGGEEVALRLNVDTQGSEVALELELKGASGSKLAKDIVSIREHKSVVGGAISPKDAAMSVNISVALGAALKELWPPVIDDVLELVKKRINIPGEVQTKTEPLVKAVLPSFKAGELDVGGALHGPDKDDKYTAVVGVKVVDGKKIEEAVKEIVKKELPPEASGLFELDAEKLDGGAMLHVVKVGQFMDEKGQKLLGKSDLYVMFRDDMLLAAIGPSAKETLKKAAASKPADVGVFQAQAALSKLVPVIGDDAGKLAAAKKAAEKVFGKGAAGADTIRFAVEGGDSLKVKIAAKGKAIQFLAELGTPRLTKDQ
ncbi:MAG TPA: hypothetical protein VKE40_21190 [Gemmataceae bacterium]|nr:hypothetical protein [Gemmataceae bacterium]